MYSCEVARQHKVALVIAIDQSSSMAQEITMNSARVSKAQFVSIVVGELIDELLLRSRYDDIYRDYYDIAILGYSSNSVRSLLSDEVGFVTISELSQRLVERDFIHFHSTLLDGTVAVVPHGFPKWVEPIANGSTPMCKMLECVTELLSEWCAQPQHRHSFPPIFVNISDGMSSDGKEHQLLEAAERIKQTSTADGNTIFVNIHISSDPQSPSLLFPSVSDIDADNRYAMLLAKMSSVIPQEMEHTIDIKRNLLSRPPYVALGYNTSPAEFISMLSIGSRSDGLYNEHSDQVYAPDL